MRVRAVLILAMAITWLAAPLARPAEAVRPIVNDFEDGRTQGWTPRGSVTLASVTEAAYTGTHSLKTTGRTSAWQGPSLDLLGLLGTDADYQIRVAVRLAAGHPASTVRMTIERAALGDTSSAYDTVASSAAGAVTDSGWTVLQGSYHLTRPASGLILYVESSDATSEYYIDDLRITEYRIVNDFEDGTTQGWFPRGGVTLANVTEAANTGTHSLKTTGRAIAWEGPSLDLLGKLETDVDYRIHMAVRLAAGHPASTVRMTLERVALGDASPVYETIASSATDAVTDSGWTELHGFCRLSSAISKLKLYVESSDATGEFYIDDLRIAESVEQTGFGTDSIYILATVACTTILALVYARRKGLELGRLALALRRTVRVVGACIVFWALNVALGACGVLLTRALHLPFVSLYPISDVSVLVLSALQALTLELWRTEARQSGPTVLPPD